MAIVEALFNPTKIENIDLKLGWFAISHHWIKETKTKRNLYGKWCEIKDLETGKSVYRIIRFAPQLEKNSSDKTGGIILDWAARVELDNYGGNEKRNFHLEITRANCLQKIVAAWIHPDPNQKLFFKIGVILGLISVLLGICSLIIALIKH